MTIGQDDFSRGYADAWAAYIPDTAVGDPQFVSEDYRCGWWNGVGAASAWHEGYFAASAGVVVCPYIVGGDDECFQLDWMHGFVTAFEINDLDARGQA